MRNRRLFDFVTKHFVAFSDYVGIGSTLVLVVSLVVVAMIASFQIGSLKARQEVQRVRFEDVERSVTRLANKLFQIERELDELKAKPARGIWLGPPRRKK